MATNIYIHLTPKKTADRRVKDSRLPPTKEIQESLVVRLAGRFGIPQNVARKELEAEEWDERSAAINLQRMRLHPRGKDAVISDAGFTTYDPREVARLKSKLRELSDKMDKIANQGGRLLQNDPLMIEHRSIKKELAKYRDASNAAR